MKKSIILIVFILLYNCGFSQVPSTTYIEPTISQLQVYFGNADRVYVVADTSDYVLCSTCTVDSITVFSGAGGRKWLKTTARNIHKNDSTNLFVTPTQLNTAIPKDNTQLTNGAAYITQANITGKVDKADSTIAFVTPNQLQNNINVVKDSIKSNSSTDSSYYNALAQVSDSSAAGISNAKGQTTYIVVLGDGLIDNNALQQSIEQTQTNLQQRIADSTSTLRTTFSTAKVVIQTFISGASVQVTDTTTWLIINPDSTLPSLGVTLPYNPTNGQVVDISFGGTVTSGTVVSDLIIAHVPGQSIIGVYDIGPVLVDDKLSFKYVNSVWYKN